MTHTTRASYHKLQHHLYFWKGVEGKKRRIEKLSRMMVQPHVNRFHNCRNEVFSGKPISRLIAALLYSVINFFVCALRLVSGIATKAAQLSPKSFAIF